MKRLNIIIYNEATGRVFQNAATLEDNVEAYLSEGQKFILGEANSDTHYVVDNGLAIRPIMPCLINKTSIIANNIDAAIISNLPNPSTVYVDGQTLIVEDGTLSIKVGTIKKYPVRVMSFPYLDWEVTIHGT